MGDEVVKIGIITYHNVWNYGAALQCVALYHKLKEMGIDVEIIDYQPKYAQHCFVYQNPFIKAREGYGYSSSSSIFGKCKEATKWFLGGVKSYTSVSERKKKSQKFRGFITNNTTLTRKYNSITELRKSPPQEDIYVCGSDQIWNPIVTRGVLDPAYYLQFGDSSVKRVAYAASACKLNPSQFQATLQKYLQRFDYISLRENELVQEISNITNRKIDVCADPTLIVDKEFFTDISKPVEGIEKGNYILLYFLGAANEAQNAKYINRYIESIKKRLPQGKIIVDISASRNDADLKYLKNLGPAEFIWLIENADMVATNSFHAMVFSVLNHKNFVIVPRDGMNSRINNLSSITHIQGKVLDCLKGAVCDERCIVECEQHAIDYKVVDDNLNEVKMLMTERLERVIGGLYED